MNEVVLQDFVEPETLAEQQVEATQARIKYFEVELPKLE
jgi:hypothetical protein